MTKAYLLTWNSLRWSWTNLAQEVRRVAAGETVTSRWGWILDPAGKTVWAEVPLSG